MQTLITGSAGFIGFHYCLRAIRDGKNIVGIDNFEPYYDPALKLARVNLLKEEAKRLGTSFTLTHCDINCKLSLDKVFQDCSPTTVVHLAAQAGVRYSQQNPQAYLSTNIVGFGNILECCRNHPPQHLIYASSSSVYGTTNTTPYTEHQKTDTPASTYAATKKANELMAHSYSHQYKLPATGLRFFTVYGPWGRPDMAFFIFTHRIANNLPIDVFNNGRMSRDFTYVDDVVECINRVSDLPPNITKASQTPPEIERDRTLSVPPKAPHRVLNVGNGRSVGLLDYIKEFERCLNKKAELRLLPMQPGDVSDTCADTSELEALIGYRPHTSLKTGVSNFVSWYRGHYK